MLLLVLPVSTEMNGFGLGHRVPPVQVVGVTHAPKFRGPKGLATGWAKSTGGLGLEAFMKTVTVQRVTKEGLERLAPTIEALADLEDMPAHKATARR